MTYISMSLFWWKIWNLYIVYNPHNYVYIPTLTLSVSPRPHISVPTICFKYYSVLYHRDYFSIPLLLICNCFSDGEEPDSVCGCVYYYCACLVVWKLLTDSCEKQILCVLTASRQSALCRSWWSLALPPHPSHSVMFSVCPGVALPSRDSLASC